MDMAAKKRRLARELSDGDYEDPLEENSDKANVLMLNAQNRALATNLFKYKRKLDIMGASLGEASKKSATCDSLVSVISRRLQQLEDDLHSTLSMLPSDAVSAELQTSLASISKEQPDWSSLPASHALLTRLLRASQPYESVSPFEEASGEPTDSTSSSSSSHGSSTAAAALSPIAPVDSALASRLAAITRVSGAVLALLLRVAGPADTSITDVLAKQRELQAQCAHLRDSLSLKSQSVSDLAAQIKALEVSNTGLSRTLERLRYDHPDLDIDAHAKNVAPHGMCPSAGLGLGMVRSISTLNGGGGGDVVMGNTHADAATHGTVGHTSGIGGGEGSLLGGGGGGGGGGVSSFASPFPAHLSIRSSPLPTPEFVTPAPPAAADPEEMEQLRNELDVFKSRLEARLVELSEARSALLAVTRTHDELRLAKLSDEQVVASPLHIAKCAEMNVVRQQVADLVLAKGALEATLAASSARVAEAERRAGSALATNARLERLLHETVGRVAEEYSAKLDEAVRARDEALESLSTASATCASATAWRQQAEEYSTLVSTLQAAQSRNRSEWCAAIAASSAVAPLLEEVKLLGATADPQAAAVLHLKTELAAANAEKEQLTTFLQSVSEEYERAMGQVGEMQNALMSKDGEVSATHTAMQKLHLERHQWLVAKSALDKQLGDLTAAVTSRGEALGTQDTLLEAYRVQLNAKEERIRGLESELGAAVKAARQPFLAAKEAHLAVEELGRQQSLARQRVLELDGQLADTSRALKDAQDTIVDLTKRLEQRDAKIRRLREKGVSEPMTPYGGVLARGMSSSSATPFAGGGGDSNGMTSQMRDQYMLLKRMMVCTVCNKNHKDVVITKCYHLFCKDCIDENLRIRHRKCPACNTTFGADDVKSVYFAS